MRPEFVWESEDHATEIRLHLDVVDGILHECMRGLGAVPKRGAEVGGVLLGSATEDNGVRRVDIRGFEAIPIEYRHGPSYLFSMEDDRLFDETLIRLRSADPVCPVGFFRANTRDEMVLTPEDVGLLDRYFPGTGAVALLIRPYATKLSMAGFFLREEGRFSPSLPPACEFPFRRREILEEAGKDEADAAGPRKPYRPFAAPEPERAAAVAPVQRPRIAMPVASPGPVAPAAAPLPLAAVLAKPRKRWMWAPLSFIFLVVGILLGFEAAFSVRGSAAADPYDLGLTVSRTGDTLTLRWNRSAPAIRQARRGAVYIEENDRRKSRDLQPDELQNGAVVYPPSGGRVRFRLEVFPNEKDSISETVDWRE